MKLVILCYKWQRSEKGYQLPSICAYTDEHVNKLYRGVKRNLKLPFLFVVVTDQPGQFDPGINVVPLWQRFIDLGGCYRRLVMYSMNWFGASHVIMLDLDAVITGDLTSLFQKCMEQPFTINEYRMDNAAHQYYNGAFQSFQPFACSVFYDSFNPEAAKVLEDDPTYVGTDQAWISHIAGPGQPTLGPADGIYDIKDVHGNLPDNARIVFFHGARDPSKVPDEWEWVKEHWI